MLKLLMISALLSGGLLMVESNSDVGPGKWNLIDITKCEEEYHKFKFDIEKKKINRTHDGIDAYVTLDEDFTDQFAMRIDICKEVDGGCKQYQVITDESFVKFIYKYAKNNVRTCLEMGNIDPPEFPIPAGEYDIKEFIFNNDELPADGPYGEFAARGYMLRGSEEIGCIEVYAEFRKQED
ncbi:unnamed protein product [Arctia plantaginis]|uniref:Uncharacterized protein n=1 Tax=Arctia plantaginis TaxID=874455 RepID=A0A8S1AZY2_ARCPL|nr:unnamed protein product [Arctia plantaginis]